MDLSEIETSFSGNNSELSNLLAQSRGLITQLSQEIRTTSYLLHPPMLDEMGLPAALRVCASGLAERSGLKIDSDIGVGFSRLGAEKELAIFRIVQEALTNVHRHSGSPSASIRLWLDGEQIQLQIQDAGDGMPPQLLAQVQQHGGGVGTGGMRERARALGGEIKIESNGSGTTVSVTIPVAAPASALGAAASSETARA